MTNTKKNYDIIDLFKFVASILILSMHAKVFESIDSNLQFYLVQLFSRWGVPFFFTISSYFLFNREENGNITKEQLLNYTKRLAILYLSWFILNIFYITYNLYVNDITKIETRNYTFVIENYIKQYF